MSFLLLLTLFLSACGGSNTLILYEPSVTPVVAVSSPMAPTTLSGGAAWIHNCQAGWKAYQAHPIYRDGKGEEKPRDVYLYGHFWLQPSDGSLWDYIQHGRPDKEKCIENVLQVAHQNHSKVYGVLGIDVSSGAWTKEDVISYTQRAAQDARVLQPIMHQLDLYHYDGLVNDIEAGDDQNPAAFTTYNTNLRKMLHGENPQFLLGTTLIAKTTDLSTPWQNWQGLVAGAVDFVVIMALDHDAMYSHPTPIVDMGWLQQIFSYIKKIPQLAVEWELPTYCRIWKLDTGWSNQTCEYAEAAKLVHDLQNGTGGRIIEDRSQALDTPFIHYTDTNGIESYLYYETLPSLIHQAEVIQSLEGNQCLYLSFWDDDTGEPQKLWPSLNQQDSIQLC
jgi:spore germination protein YaaH